MRKNKLIKDVENYFINIIKLCDSPIYTKSDIRQIANDACSFLYLKQNEN